MTSRFTELTVDCHDPHKLAEFWCAVLGWRVMADDDEDVEIASWEPTVAAIRHGQCPPTILFTKTPDDKMVKNRLHLDLSPVSGSRDDEVARLIALGARPADIGQGEVSWVVMCDPEGNEFCVQRSLAPGEFPDGG